MLLFILTTLLLAQQTATHYGPSYNGQPLGCSGYGTYSSDNPTIAAVGPTRYTEYPCGSVITVCGTMTGMCHIVIRQDSCPGCHHNMIDLSEAAINIVCGGTYTCQVTFE